MKPQVAGFHTQESVIQEPWGGLPEFGVPVGLLGDVGIAGLRLCPENQRSVD